MTTGKIIILTRWTFVGKSSFCLTAAGNRWCGCIQQQSASDTSSFLCCWGPTQINSGGWEPCQEKSVWPLANVTGIVKAGAGLTNGRVGCEPSATIPPNMMPSFHLRNCLCSAWTQHLDLVTEQDYFETRTSPKVILMWNCLDGNWHHSKVTKPGAFPTNHTPQYISSHKKAKLAQRLAIVSRLQRKAFKDRSGQLISLSLKKQNYQGIHATVRKPQQYTSSFTFFFLTFDALRSQWVKSSHLPLWKGGFINYSRRTDWVSAISRTWILGFKIWI